MVRVGIAGIGFMGMIHFISYGKLENVEVRAICSRDERRRAGDWRGIKGNFGPPGKVEDLRGVATYQSLKDLVASDYIDVVDITLPPAMHSDACLLALEAGKHVFCEKPLALTAAQCANISAAAKSNDRLILVGHVLPFMPEIRWLRETVESKRYGDALGATFKRVIAEPLWIANYWEASEVGGPMLDLHVHDAHLIRMLFGMPRSVTSCGRMRDGVAEYWHTNFDFGPSGPLIHGVCGTIQQQGRPFNQGFEIQFEHATLVYEFAVIGNEGLLLSPPTVLQQDGTVEKPSLPVADPTDAFVAELAAMASSVEQGKPHPVLDVALAHDAICICEMENASLGVTNGTP